MAGSRKEYEMLFQLNAQLGSSYNSTFSKAQAEFTKLGNEIQQLSKVQADISSYQKQQNSITSTNAKLESLRRQHDLLQKEIEETSGSTTALEREKEKLGQKIRDTEAALERQENKLDATSARLKEAGVNTDNLADETARLGAELDDLRGRQEAAADEADNFGGTASAAFDAAGEALAAAGIAAMLKEITEAMVECAKESITFESAITGVFKTVDGTDAQLAGIVAEIKQMSTEIPATTEEIAAVAEAAGQLGIATENVTSFTRVMIDLGESTNLTADEAASSFAKFANITGTAAENYSRLGSVVVDLGNNFATTEADIVAMSTRLASAGRLAGLSEAEIMGLAASMSSVGIEAEAGGTAMTQTLSAIEEAVSVGGESLEQFAWVANMSAEEFAATWENAPIRAIQAFIAGVGSLEDRGESAVLILDELGLSGVRQSNMLKSLGLAADTLTGAVATANTAWEQDIALSVEASKRYATTESKLAMLNNAYSNLKVAIGDAYTPTLREASDVGIDMLEGATEFIQKNPALVKSVTAFVGVVGTATAAMTAYAAISKVVKALNMASMFTSPLTAISVGVAAVAAGTVAVAHIMQEEAIPTVKELTEAAREMEEVMSEAGETLEDTVLSTEATASMADTYITKLEELEAAGLNTDEQAKEYHNTLALLCQAVPELSEYINLQTNEIEGGTAALRAHTEAWKEDARQQAYQSYLNSLYENYNSVMSEVAANEIKRTQAMIDQEAAQKGMTAAYENFLNVLGMTDEEFKETWGSIEKYQEAGNGLRGEVRAAIKEYYGFKNAAQEAGDTIDACNEAIEVGNTALTEAEGAINTAQQSLNDLTGATDEEATAAANLAAQQEALTTAIASVEEQAKALAEAYNEAYNAAYDSITGQKELWDEAAEVSKTSVDDMNKNLHDQAQYWSEYNANLESLTARTGEIEGLREVIASFADGSEDSVNAIAGMATASDEDLKEMVANWQDLKKQQEEASGSLAELKTNFSTQMDELEGEVADSVAALSLGDEAAQAAKETLQGFIDGANEMRPAVQQAFNQVAAAAQLALINKGVGFGLTYNIPGYADGTDYAARGWAMVGEEGPELAYFGGGERVIPAEKTAAILGDSGGTIISISLAPSYQFEGGTPNVDQLQDVLEANNERIKEIALEAIQEAGIDTMRRAYA